MTQKKPTLGRGLADLLGQARPAAPAVPAPQAADAVHARVPADQELARLPLDLLQRGRYQPRMDMRPETLSTLADSIRAQGVIQPILVRPLGEETYEIIAGERRFRAAQLAGLDEVPVLVKLVADEAALAIALIENIQREDLNALEQAHGVQRLIREFGFTHEQAAQAIGRSRSATTNLLQGGVAAATLQAAANATISCGEEVAALALSTATGIDLYAASGNFAAGNSSAIVTLTYAVLTLS